MTLAKQGKKFEAFDQAVEYYLEPDIPDHQRNNTRKKLLFQMLMFCAGYHLDDLEQTKHIADDCLNMLEQPPAGVDCSSVATCLLRFLEYPQIEWVEENRWRGVIAGFIRTHADSALFAREWKIDLSRMGHTAIVELRQNVQTVKDDFLRTLDISSLDRVNAQKSTTHCIPLQYINKN